MTRDEIKQRTVWIPGAKRSPKPGPVNVRIRGENYIEAPQPHESEYFDDFFEYEKEIKELIPARETISAEIDRYSESKLSSYKNDSFDEHYNFSEEEYEQVEEFTSKKPGFIIMEPLEDFAEKHSNNTDTIEKEDPDSENLPFEFIQCNFIKEDGEQCKKQAKKGFEYCGIHRRYIEKNNL